MLGGIVIDVLVVSIILLSTILGYKKGLIKVGAKLFAGIIAIVLAFVLYKPISSYIIESTPAVHDIANQIRYNVDDIVVSSEAENLAKNIVMVLTSIGLYVVLKILLNILFSILNGIAKLPILRQFNEAGGLIYGILRGVIWSFIIVALLSIYAKIEPQSDINNFLNDSYIINFVQEKLQLK